MNDNRYFALVVPLSPTTQKLAQDKQTSLSVRQAVWSQAAEHLKPILGKSCISFYPAVTPYGRPVSLPFGVVLGCTDSEEFLICYQHARRLQEKEIETRSRAIRSTGKRIGQFHPDDGTTLTVTAFRSSDPKLQEHLEVARRFFSNDITAAAGLYYLGYNSNYISEQQEQRLTSNLDAYALCVAELRLKGVPS